MNEELLIYAQKSAEKFWTDAGHFYLCGSLDLTPESRCIDVGGYLGDWTAYINNKFNCFVDVYEPVRDFYNQMLRRFTDNSKIRVFNFGLESFDKQVKIAMMKEGSTTYAPIDTGPFVNVRDINPVAQAMMQAFGKIDLLAINGEGCEYNLLDRLIGTGAIAKVKNILVQFHTFVPDAESRHGIIQENLKPTHEKLLDHPFVWESWRKK